MTSSLTARSRKTQPKKLEQLNEEKLTILQALQDKFILSQILALYRKEGRYTLDVDACITQILCVLVQERQQSRQRNRILLLNVERPLPESEHYIRRVHCSRLGDLSPMSAL